MAQKKAPSAVTLTLLPFSVTLPSDETATDDAINVRYTKKANRWVVGAEYLLKNYDYRGTSVPRAQFTAEGGYYLKFLSDPTKTFFLSIGGSALAGYETVNWGDRLLHDGSTLLVKDAFIYGGAITLELESYITDHIVLLANVRERVLWGGSLGKFSTQFGLGIKFIIN